jgi:hypothetical protein
MERECGEKVLHTRAPYFYFRNAIYNRNILALTTAERKHKTGFILSILYQNMPRPIPLFFHADQLNNMIAIARLYNIRDLSDF